MVSRAEFRCVNRIPGCIISFFNAVVYCFPMDAVLVDSGFFSFLRGIVDTIQSFRMAKVDWTLSLCCGTQEVIFCVLCGGYLIINYFLWNVFLVKPMKLIAVFVHEMGHGKRKD